MPGSQGGMSDPREHGQREALESGEHNHVTRELRWVRHFDLGTRVFIRAGGRQCPR